MHEYAEHVICLQTTTLSLSVTAVVVVCVLLTQCGGSPFWWLVEQACPCAMPVTRSGALPAAGVKPHVRSNVLIFADDVKPLMNSQAEPVSSDAV